MTDTDPEGAYDVWPAAEVVGSGDLVGREDIIDAIATRLAGRSVLLAAPRRVGKTCVARETLRRLSAKGYLTASVDFFRISSKRDFAEVLTKQLLEASHSLRSRLRRLASTVTRAANSVQPHITLAETEFGIRLGAKDEDENHLFQQALQLPEQLAEREDRHVAILMDEFQEADRNLGPDVYRIMRSYFQEQHRTQQLFAGSRASLLRKLFTAPRAALLRYATEVPLPWPSFDDWETYIRSKYASAGISCSASVARAIVTTTAGHPADTMELCQQLHSATQQASLQELDTDLLAVAERRAEGALRPVFDEIWEDLGSTRYSRRLAQRVAQGLPPYGDELHSQLTVDALNALMDKGVLEHVGRHYRFPEPLFEHYVTSMLP